jgi:spore coat-associated protein N
MSASTRPASTRSTTRKIVGSLGVIGTAAAVAGLGTFGTFTDSTTPVETEIQSGSVDIDLTQPAAAIPVTTAGFVPGDSMSRAVTLSNKGTAGLSMVSLAVTAPVSSVLNTDTVNGLQLTLKACTVPWTQGGTASAPTYTCGAGGTEKFLSSGPVVGNFSLPTPSSLNPAGVDHLVFTITLPTGANNDFQNKTSKLNLVFSGTQRAGTAR